MIAFRLCDSRFPPYDGEGPRLYGGRWNHKGTALVYTAENRSLAVLECVVHLAELPVTYVMGIVTVPDEVRIEDLPQARLPAGWNRERTSSATRDLGTEWARSGRSSVLRVPSVVVPEEHNYLLNPAHPDFVRPVLRQTTPFQFDRRLRS